MSPSHTDPQAFRRSISDNERLYLSMQELFSCFAIQLVVEGEGRVDPVGLCEAVAAAAEACPGARVVLRGDMWVDSGVQPPVHLAGEGEFDGSNFEDFDVLNRKLDPVSGPTCEVVLLRQDPAVLVFRALHSTMDGKGTILWIDNVFRALRGESPVSVLGVQTDLSLIRGLQPRNEAPDLRLSVRTSKARAKEVPYQVWRKRLTLPGQPPAMVAQTAELLTELGCSSSNRFLVPVDLRRHGDWELCSGNLTLPIFLDAHAGESWQELHGRLIAALARGEELNLKSADLGLALRVPKWVLKAGLRSMLAIQNLRNRQPCGGVISNLGLVDLEALSARGFSASTLYSLTVQQPFVPFAVAIASNNRCTEVMISCYGDPEQRAQAERFLVALSDRLAPQDEAPKETLVRLFLGQVAKAPDAVALVQGTEEWTYAELESQAQSIVQQLEQVGLRPGQTVAVCMGRGVLLVPTMLAILSMGATYLPLEPGDPQQRLQYILELSEAEFCIVDAAGESRIGSASPCKVMRVGRTETPHTQLRLKVGYQDPVAYQIFTSGTSGSPKGVLVGHGTLCNYLAWAQGFYGVGADSRFPLFASIAFDSTLTSMLLPLVSGGSIELLSEITTHALLRGIFESASITHVKLAPAHLCLALDSNPISNHAKTLVLGGEQLGLELAQKAHGQLGPGWRLVNEYGPTEATIGCVVHSFDPARAYPGDAVPIGRSITHVSAHVLDGQGEPTATGELYLSGRCLAQGYGGRGVEAQIGFSKLADGTRVYRTGDRVRIDADGELTFLGRMDDQVSLHGHRVELSEVEACMLRLEGVGGAAVVVRARGNGEPELAGFFVSESGVTDEEMQKHLAVQLPKYMQPSTLQCLLEWPLTGHGKVDRSALLDGNSPTRPVPEQPIDSSPTEVALMQIWRKALEFEPDEVVHATDEFYRLGGDSLALLEVLRATTQTLLGSEFETAFMGIMNEWAQGFTLRRMADVVDELNHRNGSATGAESGTE
ncbi:MAG: non-ribosomal peptide synthetase [bacterium]|nr:non-ribosomal peptide synthetase [bacterium]